MYDAWYKEQGLGLAESLHETMNAIEDDEGNRQRLLLRWLRMYSARMVSGFDSSNYNKTSFEDHARSKWNVIRSCVDTALSHIGTQRPRVKFLTTGGDWEAQRKAKNLTKFLDGLWLSKDLYKTTRRAARDGMIFGTGACFPFREDDDICIEHVPIDELHVDPKESRHGKPRNLYRKKQMATATCIAMFPDEQPEILASLEEEGETCEVVEAWHLGDHHTEGRHVICINGSVVAEDEPWEHDRFPIEFFHWSEPAIGFWGCGIGEILEGIQVDINFLLRKIHNNLKSSSTKIYVERGSKVVKNHIARNVDFEIIEYTGKPPVAQPQRANSNESYAQLENLVSKAYELIGISQLAAQSKKPAGLDSGAALREYQYNQSQRFLEVQQAWQEFHVRVGKCCMMIAKDIARDNPSFSVMAKAKNSLEEIKWSDVEIEETDYIMQPWPVSLLPHSPEGRMQTVSELLKVFPQLQDYALNLLEFPDLESMNDVVSANHNIMELIVWNIAEKDNFIGPEPMMDLPFAVRYMTAAYLKHMAQGADENVLQMLRSWISQAVALINMAKPPTPAPMPSGPQAPTRQPQAPLPESVPMAPPGAPVGSPIT